MKLKAIIGCVLVAMVLTVASPALALSLGVSPAHLELEVPGDGSATTNVKIHYFSGDVKISLINIPLRIEPSTVHVEASNEPVDVELTIYGDDSLGSQVYDGFIRFIAVSGGAATGGVQVIAKVTNVSDGIPVSPSSQAPATQEPEPVVEKPAPEVAPTPSVTTEASPQTPPEAGAQPGTEFPLIPILIGLGSAVVLILLVVAGIAIGRRT